MYALTRAAILSVILVFALTACGGGGGGNGGNNQQPPPPPPVDTSLDWDNDNWDEKEWQ